MTWARSTNRRGRARRVFHRVQPATWHADVLMMCCKRGQMLRVSRSEQQPTHPPAEACCAACLALEAAPVGERP